MLTFNTENIFLLGSILVLVSIFISKTGYRFGVPTLLLFLFTGMLFGSDGMGLHFNSPADAQFIGMMALSVILFSGGMETKFKEIRTILGHGVMLSTPGVILTTALTGIFIFILSQYTAIPIELSLTVSLLLAATISSTDSASVFNLLRSQRMELNHPHLTHAPGHNHLLACPGTAPGQARGEGGQRLWRGDSRRAGVAALRDDRRCGHAVTRTPAVATGPAQGHARDDGETRQFVYRSQRTAPDGRGRHHAMHLQ